MIQDKIKADMADAMRSKDKVKLSTLRGLLSAFTNELVNGGKKPDEKIDDDTAMVVIKRAVKQRRDSIDQFEKGGRPDLVESEKEELKVLEEYVPESMSKEEIRKIAETKKEELQITDKSKIGILMGAVMKDLKGKADGGDVKEVVESLLSDK
ncbi:MAG: hypothetical protein COV70_00875 [Parcubacteria group bacterium CG11_big_fil_rev_8_21_14_0_20_39_22]|nr:MAG: hypothetical protein COV70_00875 [Parcubacteria group bacterium CG11_big_fil_rev_8_21_14_0_20_39_22]